MRNRPGGAHRIATELRDQGWDIEVVDFAYMWGFRDLRKLLKRRMDKNLKWIGFSQLYTGWSPEVEKFCAFIKTKYPDIVTVLGSMMYETTGSNFIDYYVKGYGERSIIALLKYLFSNGKKPNIVGVDGNQVLLSEGDCKSTPWKDPLIKYEDRDFIQPWEWLSVEFSRGCKFACAFCNFPELGVKGDYTRDASSFEYQMKDTYDRYGVSRYIVSDETFNDTVQKITKFADAVENLDFDPFFSGFVRADLLVSRPQEREEMLRMNMLGHFYGIESFNQETGRAVGKGMNPDKLKEGLLDTKKYFLNHGTGRYRATISLIAGLPYEPNESLDRTEQWMLDNWEDQGFMYFPLEIPSPSVNQSSKLTLEYKKYGYEIMDVDEIYSQAHLGLKTRSDLLPWKNEHTNYQEVQTRVDRFANSVHTNYFKLGNFPLSTVAHNMDDLTIDELLELPNSSENYSNAFHNKEMEFVHSYIQKKINYL